MRIQLLSDLHLERYPTFVPHAVGNVDVLVLAGDIGSYQAGSLLNRRDFGLERFSPNRLGARWPRVLFVPGNHELDSLDFEEGLRELRGVCAELGIEWLDQAEIVIDDVRFLGTTLWSDFDALSRAEKTEPRQLAAREKAFRAANFYLRKNTSLRAGEPLLAEGIREISLECQAWLRQALARPYAGKTVVVTHFAPSLRSADPRYGLTPGTAGFCNALDDLFKSVDLWLHGHLHCINDYIVEGQEGAQPWRCRVVANPLGYAAKGEQDSFRPGLVIEL